MKKVDKQKFQSFWKTKDKEWMKERRKGWKDIQIQLDRMRDNDHFDLNSMKKKDYTFLKNYYLTGKDTPERKLDSQLHCLSQYIPCHGYMLFQFWLCPDHSVETLEYLKSSKYNIYSFRRACKTYRNTAHCYSGSYKWLKEEGTTISNGPIFGELEPRMLELFSYDSETIKKYDDINLPVTPFLYSIFEGVLLEFLDEFKPIYGTKAGYNPHNPILNLIDEYMRWGFPQDHGDSFHYDDSPKFHITSYALIMYVVDTPEGRPALQLEFAKELKQRILDALPELSDEANARWDTAVKFYKEGGLKPKLVKYKL